MSRKHNTVRIRFIMAAAAAFGLSMAVAAQPAYAATSGVLGKCVTRTLASAYTYNGWEPRDVCPANEVAISAGGFCSNGASDTGARLIGVSTTSGTVDRRVWLWCSQPTAAIWYAMCCDSLE
jgi:hypothetical protein